MSRLLSMLGLCRKAGKLAMGFDASADAVQKGQAALVVLASDLSPKSAKEIAYLADKRQIDILRMPAVMDEIKRTVGKRVGILAVTDEQLAVGVRKASMARQEEEKSV